MIYFQTKPAAVFEAILQEALLSEMTEVKMLADDGAIGSWEGLYPQTSVAFEPYTAIRVMAQLLAATRDVSVHRLADAHWLVLYECLQNFCAMHNELLEDDLHAFRSIGAFRMGHVDAEALVAIYFWDTDFLISSESEDVSLFENDIFGEDIATDTIQDCSSNLEEDNMPMLEVVDEIAWIVPEPSAFFRTDSTQYPDVNA